MILTQSQQIGLDTCISRYLGQQPYTVIAGWAGTGKSTLIKFIIEALGVNPQRVAFVAPTGKAAQVLRSKGNENAMTIHRLLYEYKPKKDGTFFRKKVPTFEIRKKYDLIIVDEVSMVAEELWKLLLSHRIHVIACGDPAQLPSISEGTDVLDYPHVFLNEIMRQSQESEIIRLTMDIRAGKKIRPYRGKDINIVRRKDFCDGMLTWADQTICGLNNTRTGLNDLYRAMQYGQLPEIPQEGERCICLKNNWDIPSTNGDALVNGLTGHISNIRISPVPHKYYGRQMYLDFYPDDGTNSVFKNLLVDYKLFTTGTPTINKDNFSKFGSSENKLDRPNELTYAPIITCHKSQGSEWPKVLVIEENWPRDKEEHTRWLYTACTRAQEKLTLVLNY